MNPGQRVIGAASGRHGTIDSLRPGGLSAIVRWDDGQKSVVSLKQLKEETCSS